MLTTLYSRLKEMKYVLSQSQKAELGRIIANEYFKLPSRNRPFLYKTKSHENDGTFEVWVYPKRFIQTMDEVIIDYCKKQGIKKKRERISAERVSSSVKPSYKS